VFSHTVRPATDILFAMRDQALRTPALMKTAFERTVKRSIRRVKPEITTYPARLPSLPFKWSNDPAADARARRWYFANKVKGRKGGRYKRTGGLAKSWQFVLETTNFAGAYRIQNMYRGAVFVQGFRQVPSHRQTGWSVVREVVDREMARLENELIESWFTVSDPFAGVPR
jgi:hypothetical protein